MPTVPRRAAAQQQRDRLQGRRLRAAGLFAAGVRQAEVARQFGVSAQAVSVWYACWERGGIDALSSRGPSGPAPRLLDAQLATVEQALLEGRLCQRVHRRAVDPGPRRAGDRAADRRAPSPPTSGRCCAIGWAGVCSVPSVAPSNATRQRSTAGSRSGGRGSSKCPTTQSLSGLLGRARAQPDPERAPQLGAGRPAAGADPPVQLEEGLHGGRAVLRRPRRRRPARLSTSPPATTTPTPPGRGDRPGPQGHRPRPENAAPDLLVPPARRPVGRLSRQDNRILQQGSLGGAGSGAWRLEQLDGVAGGIIQQNLLATKPGHDVVAELHPCLA
jgi:transposase-like protein